MFPRKTIRSSTTILALGAGASPGCAVPRRSRLRFSSDGISAPVFWASWIGRANNSMDCVRPWTAMLEAFADEACAGRDMISGRIVPVSRSDRYLLSEITIDFSPGSEGQ